MRWRPSSSVTLPSPGFIQPCIPQSRKTGADLCRLDPPRIVEAVRRLKVKTVLLDGEGVVYDQHGMPSFDLIHSKQYDREVSLVAFDLLELDGDDVRRQPLLNRKSRLAKLIAKVRRGRHRVCRAHRNVFLGWLFLFKRRKESS